MRGLVALAVAGLVACGGGIHRFQPNFYSLDGDVRLGQRLAREIEGETPPLRHTALAQLVDGIGRRLQARAPHPAFRRFPYGFRVVDSPEVNAFALPGGPVYVNLALVELCDTEDQLAAVLAHEMSHVAARHATEMLTTRNLTQLALVAAVMASPVPLPPLAWEGAKLAYVLALLRYSRGKELEADRLGLGLMHAAGYDAEQMGTVFGKLAAQRGSAPSLLERFVSSHPLDADRLRAVERELATLPAREGLPVVAAPASPFSQVQLMFARD
jgi:predicted Zn-dependent protease